jgi:threonyl-tRNA synthetase
MRALFLHSDYLEYEVREAATEAAEEVPEDRRKGRMEDVLVCFLTAEARDEADPEGVARKAAQEVEAIAAQVKTRNVVLYPYAHLSQSLAAPEPAKRLFAALARNLEGEGYHVLASPFGWYKAFRLAVKGHPLSELAREIVLEEDGEEEVSAAVKAEETLVSEWHVLEPDGTLHPLHLEDGDLAGYDFEGWPNLRRFAAYEMAKGRGARGEPPHVRLMRDLELVDYEPGSDPGNLRYYAKGRLVKALLEEIVTGRTVAYGAMEVESPVMYDFEHPALKSYVDRFPARQYLVETPNKRAFLRFAACFGQFLIGHDMTLSYRHLPVRLYELTRYSFRAEQRGELAGLRRLRAFTMPDCHAFVADLEMAKEEFLRRFELAWSLMEAIGFGLPDDFELGLRVTRTFYDAHRDFIEAFARRWGKPLLVEMWSEQFFYFVLKYEFNFVDALGKAAALTTDQIDTENGARFDITFTDADGAARHPLILHLSPSGAIERVIYALLERAHFAKEAGRPPSLPVWLSPVQVRIVPVSDDQADDAVALAQGIDDVRVDVDDTADSLGKKIRRAEKAWIPYVAVLGRKEVARGTLNVRVRETGKQEEMTLDALLERIRQETSHRPFRPLSMPVRVSLQPSFRG